VCVAVVDAKRFCDAPSAVLGSCSASNLILIDSDSTVGENLTPTFNTQMYHLGSRVRTGESSGSIHNCAGVPVVCEMNGSELIEELRVIKERSGSSTGNSHCSIGS
jgi:hypothetical protein